MSGNTITHDITATAEQTGTTRGTVRDTSLAPSRAARELGLRRRDFDLAVRLGRIRTVPDEKGGGRRVARDEIERIRAGEGFPEALRDSVRAVGTTEGAALMEMTKSRFTRLARLGLLVPMTFYVNRYRAVVWLYLADDLRQFAADERNSALLKGRTPEGLRDQLTEGLDLRPRNWRGRHLGFLLRQAHDPWSRAAAMASLLSPVDVSEVVRDPYERSHLHRIRPAPPAHGTPGSPATRLTEEIMTATDPDEIDWLRTDLAGAVEAARRQRPAPRPALRPVPPPPPGRKPTPHTAEETGRLRGLLGRIWRQDS
ncbi:MULTISPECIES: DUF6397 family protein [unclassified Streptomyces]|uniref:DUF6397 family protein n=1 Tax=unclassified Streptomyces TaxID=2593676 RepID=UPI0024423F4D|nr:DUF6397 family protein [Streptomyces sp. DH41]MDG9725288.1 DUF6397 family protein [Streptomyces sp. DH41]